MEQFFTGFVSGTFATGMSSAEITAAMEARTELMSRATNMHISRHEEKNSHVESAFDNSDEDEADRRTESDKTIKCGAILYKYYSNNGTFYGASPTQIGRCDEVVPSKGMCKDCQQAAEWYKAELKKKCQKTQ